ncbi:P2Y purinoceptor 13-like [Arapaima gigas]
MQKEHRCGRKKAERNSPPPPPRVLKNRLDCAPVGTTACGTTDLRQHSLQRWPSRPPARGSRPHRTLRLSSALFLWRFTLTLCELISLRRSSMNSSGSNSTNRCARDMSVTSLIFPCLYSVLFLAAFLLNSLACWIFFQVPSSSTFVVYLKNVVVADLLMTLTLPVKVLADLGLGPWQVKVFHCRYSAVLFYTCMYVSIVLLGLISLDRYLKIVHPFGRCVLQRVGCGKALCAGLWLLLVPLALPNTVLSNRAVAPSPTLKCSSLKGPAGLGWHEGFNYFCQLLFWGTLVLMVVCYTAISRKVFHSYVNSRSRSGSAAHRTKARVFIVVVVFFICFAPFHFTRVPYTLSQTRGAHTCAAQHRLYVTKTTTLWLSATNICLDPLIYIFLCGMFRRKLAGALRCQSVPAGPSESATDTTVQMQTKRPTELTAQSNQRDESSSSHSPARQDS